jgi:hypothetical protein
MSGFLAEAFFCAARGLLALFASITCCRTSNLKLFLGLIAAQLGI